MRACNVLSVLPAKVTCSGELEMESLTASSGVRFSPHSGCTTPVLWGAEGGSWAWPC